jgi:hypothetical protein
MNTDIRLKVGFFGHHKIVRLKARLGADAVLSLLQLWMFTAQYHPDGDLSSLDPNSIAISAGWPLPEALDFYEALADLKLLDVCATHDSLPSPGNAPRIMVHDWAEHQPWCVDAKVRSVAARVAAQARWAGKGKSIKKERVNALRIEPQCDPQCDPHYVRNAPLPSFPLPTNPKDQLPCSSEDVQTDEHPEALPYTPVILDPERVVEIEVAPSSSNGGTPKDFEAFWKDYPRKVGKGRAIAIWKRLGSKRPPLLDLTAAIVRAKQSEQWTKDNGKYIPYPATWLSQQRWLDEHDIEDDYQWLDLKRADRDERSRTDATD